MWFNARCPDGNPFEAGSVVGVANGVKLETNTMAGSRARFLLGVLGPLTLALILVAGCGPARGGGGDDDDLLISDEDESQFNNATVRPEEREALDGDCGDALESGAMELLNAERESAGLSTLTCDLDVLDVARSHSQDISDRNFFDHKNPDGEQPWDRLDRGGVGGWRGVGENIAAGQRTPSEVHTAWMNSPGHRANILTPEYTHAAIGIFETSDGTILWTQVFVTF